MRNYYYSGTIYLHKMISDNNDLVKYAKQFQIKNFLCYTTGVFLVLSFVKIWF
jgi:hypothetical protein